MRTFHADMPTQEADRLAVDNAITFYVAGHETTATALAWAAYLLAAQPAIQEELRTEAAAAIDADAMVMADRLPLLRRFLDETMRLYPPVVQIIREALADDEIGGRPIRKGELVFVYPWILHRHRSCGIDRTLSISTVSHPIARPRCTASSTCRSAPARGSASACVSPRSEALVILAHWLVRRRFRLPPGFAPMPHGTITLRPQHGMPLIIEPVN